MPDLSTLKKHAKPNQFLVLPAGFGSETPDAQSPTFALPPERLFELVSRVVGAEPRTHIGTEDAAARRLEVVQRTPLLRFADDVTIEVVPADGGAALAIYSRSRVGYSDLGTNAKRVLGWLAKIRAAVDREAQTE